MAKSFWERREDYAKKVSGEIIDQIKAGVAPWQKPWKRHHSRHEAPVRVRFAGPDKLVHLVEAGEVVERLGRGVADRLDRPVQIGDDFTDRNQLVAFKLHGSFSHVPQTRPRGGRGQPMFSRRVQSMVTLLWEVSTSDVPFVQPALWRF